MPQQVALDVEALFTVGTEKRPLARVRPLVYDHGCVTREHFLTNVAQLLMTVNSLWLRRGRIVHQGELLLGVFGLYVTYPLLGRWVHVTAHVTL